VDSREFRSRVKKTAKAAALRIANLGIMDRYILSFSRLPFHFVETSARGFWNAFLVHQNGASPDTLVIAKLVNAATGDPERFLAQLAVALAKNPNCKEIDLLLAGHDERPVTIYSAIARMFGRRLNLRDVAKTLTSSSSVSLEGLSQSRRDPVLLASETVGILLAPALSKNTAREYLKAIDPTGRFCAMSLGDDGPNSKSISALRRIVDDFSDWHFVVLNDAWHFDSQELPPKVHLPSRAGLDVLTRLCIAAEVDAFVGADDVYGLTAALSGKPAHLAQSANSSCGVSLELPNAHCLREFSCDQLRQSLTCWSRV
jgi:hypothetical protein